MLDKPEIIQIEAQLAAVIRLIVPREEIRKVMGPGMAEVRAAAGAQGIGPAGPLFTHHFRMDPATFDFEVGVAVTAPVSPVGRVKAGELPAARVARTILPRPVRRPGRGVGRVPGLGAERGPHARAEPLGALPHRSGVEPRSPRPQTGSISP